MTKHDHLSGGMQTPPVEGCWVRLRNEELPGRRSGRVVETRHTGNGCKALIQFTDGSQGWFACSQLECGFEAGMTVQHIPRSTSRKSLGTGTVLGTRKLGQRRQVLVQMHETGESLWLPFEQLRRVKDACMLHVLRETDKDNPAERFRLKFLAHALENWNHLTGALDRLDIDPLPHQIHLVHTILASGNWNWLIADDVGLGKTIEVGLLLSALKRRGHLRRVLIVCPAGLVRQWQDEMKFKFNEKYLVHGLDFHINDPEHWKLYDHVIMSLDRAKQERHLDMLRQAPPWDMVIFDEAHKLSRHEKGTTQRYELARTLRQMTDNMLLLTATPHQGYNDRFRNLLKLVRPDLSHEINLIDLNPDVVAEMVLRNRKSLVTDDKGNFVFKGLQVHRVGVEPSEDMRRFNALLKEYVVRGYRAAEGELPQYRAIGFVMTTFRKLASSSIAAIERALRNRLNRLRGSGHAEAARSPDASTARNALTDFLEEGVTEEELLEGGDLMDDDAVLLDFGKEGAPSAFFGDEARMLEELLSLAGRVRQDDRKLQTFLEEIAAPLVAQGKRLLIFTEYRGTQEYLVQALKERFPQAGEPARINGSMTLPEKLEAVRRFNDPGESGARFLVSTEAGGEGLNLHEACHVMVNYDLPWNPARLMQRIGRLYRYGQQERVIVFNLHSDDNFDESIIDLMMRRVEKIIADMAGVGDEFNERLKAEIVGELLENLDLVRILGNARDMSEERTAKEVEEALERARNARDLQEGLLRHAAHFDPGVLKRGGAYSMEHVLCFVKGMLKFTGIRLRRELHDGDVLELELPDDLVGRFPAFGRKRIVRVTTSRRRAQRQGDLFLLDFESDFFRYLVREAKGHDFGGQHAVVSSAEADREGVLAGVQLRWQNDAGRVVHSEFVALFMDERGRMHHNPDFIPALLCEPQTRPFLPASVARAGQEERKAALRMLLHEADRLLAAESNAFRHPNDYVFLLAADVASSRKSAFPGGEEIG